MTLFRNFSRRCGPIVLSVAVSATVFAPIAGADEGSGTESSAARLDRAVQQVAGAKRTLRYKFEKGQKIRWKVVHLSTVNLRDKNFSQETQSRTTSLKLWTVEDVSDDGSAKIVNSVEWGSLWQKVDGEDPVTFDSRTDENPPIAFQPFADSIGVPLSTKVIDARGVVVSNEGQHSYDLGAGPVLPPFPEEAIGVGHRWSVADEVKIRVRTVEQKTVKVRYVYTLSAIDERKATIDVRTEVLTPIDDPQEKAQIVQRIIEGTVEVDLEKGMVSERKYDWKATVVGFNGQTGTMDMLARLTEELTDGSEANAPAAGEPQTAKAPLVGPALK